ncbi:transglutaminase family protein [Prosthecomicrobium sp. N25]|uniref:transglutaminase family protein n=1 Tax=Prosthecomicrobium sp. N25 TaxID=3129254 RepID=UPI003077F502
MRLRITHETLYAYEKPATYAIQALRLMPRGSDNQYVVDWRIDVSQDCRLAPVDDHYGNLTHAFSIDGPIAELSIVASGEVVTEDPTGVLRGVPERMPPKLYLRDTALTKADSAIRDFAREVAAGEGGDRLSTLHALMRRLNRELRYDREATEAATTAAEAFATDHGVCQDLAHIFVSAARVLDIPARYVSGYMYDPAEPGPLGASHAWAEAWVGGSLGWIGFDAANDRCPTDAYVRLACGLDYLDAAPIRGTRYGGDGEAMTVRVTVEKTGEF